MKQSCYKHRLNAEHSAGAVLIFLIVAILAGLATLGLTVESTNALLSKLRLQRVLEGASLYAAPMLLDAKDSADYARIVSRIKDSVEQNILANDSTISDATSIRFAELTVDESLIAIEVVVPYKIRFLGSLFGFSSGVTRYRTVREVPRYNAIQLIDVSFKTGDVIRGKSVLDHIKLIGTYVVSQLRERVDRLGLTIYATGIEPIVELNGAPGFDGSLLQRVVAKQVTRAFKGANLQAALENGGTQFGRLTSGSRREYDFVLVLSPGVIFDILARIPDSSVIGLPPLPDVSRGTNYSYCIAVRETLSGNHAEIAPPPCYSSPVTACDPDFGGDCLGSSRVADANGALLGPPTPYSALEMLRQIYLTTITEADKLRANNSSVYSILLGCELDYPGPFLGLFPSPTCSPCSPMCGPTASCPVPCEQSLADIFTRRLSLDTDAVLDPDFPIIDTASSFSGSPFRGYVSKPYDQAGMELAVDRIFGEVVRKSI